MPNLKSAVEQVGSKVTQVIHFSNGNKRTFTGIITETIRQGEFTKMFLDDGRLLMVNTENVDCIEVFSEEVRHKQEELKAAIDKLRTLNERHV